MDGGWCFDFMVFWCVCGWMSRIVFVLAYLLYTYLFVCTIIEIMILVSSFCILKWKTSLRNRMLAFAIFMPKFLINILILIIIILPHPNQDTTHAFAIFEKSEDVNTQLINLDGLSLEDKPLKVVWLWLGR